MTEKSLRYLYYWLWKFSKKLYIFWQKDTSTCAGGGGYMGGQCYVNILDAVSQMTYEFIKNIIFFFFYNIYIVQTAVIIFFCHIHDGLAVVHPGILEDIGISNRTLYYADRCRLL